MIESKNTGSYDFKSIEKKWQKKWEDKKCFEVDVDKEKEKFYNLEMFPYPSGAGLHIGHSLNYTIGDIRARFKRMLGFNVLYPMGYDSFGLPAENAAIKVGEHPRDYTKEAISNFIEQQKALGLSYDWSKMLSSCEPEYYKWNQKFFIEFLKKGLAYKKKANVNWCSKCETVLANEQVHNGCCWRHEDIEVEIKPLEQWFIKTTEYAEELLDMVDDLDWPDRIKLMQKNWIGKSYGAEILFEVEKPDNNIGNVVIVHGCPGKNKKPLEKENKKKRWRFWVKNELLKKGINCETPEMPSPWQPKYKDWKKEFDKIKIDENSILVGHSAGGGFLVRWLGETKKKIKKLILVAPAIIHSCEWHNLSDLLDFEISDDLKNVNEILLFISKDDSEGLLKSSTIFESALNLRKKEFDNKGHFTEKTMGTDKFPEIIDEILSKEKFPIFTTRPDTIFGATFMVMSAQHPRLNEFVSEEKKKEVEKFLKKIKSVSEKDADKLNKEGVFTGSYAINPINNEKIPIYAGNFVVADYGSGMVMAVPAHDQRDFDFAKKYGIEIKEVVRQKYGVPHKNAENRNTVSVVLHRKKDNKFAMLNWKDFGWVSPVVGGIKEGESLEKASEREVLEEIGCKVKFVKKLGNEIESYYYADNKKVWRSRVDQPVLVELIEENSCKVKNNEKNLHELVWMSSEEALDKITHEYNKIGLMRYLGVDKAYTEKGVLINSDKFNDLDNEKAKDEIVKFLEKKKLAKKKVQYKMRDWLISRQRYWGTPIPVVYCDKCGIVPEKEDNLPVELPYDVEFGKGNPLLTNENFVNCKCPKCSGDAKRETDTMDTFVDSSWYYMRYPDNNNSKEAFDKKKEDYWLPVDSYIGGAEHATMHLLYARFWTKALRDLGYVNFDEPFIQLFNQGMLHASDGRKMSKSLGNVINPLEIINDEGADALRLTLMSFASPDSDTNWDEKVLQGNGRFLAKVYDKILNIKVGKSSARIESKLNKTIKEVSEMFDNFKYNLAIIKIRDLFNSLNEEESKEVLEKSLQLLHPICPHITEELWEKLGNKDFISLSKWPVVDETKIDEKFEKEEQAVDKLVGDINNISKLMEEKGNDFSKVYVYVLPQEKEMYESNLSDIMKRVGNEVVVYSVSDKDKHDPEGKSKKAKPGKPALYLE